MRADAIGQCVRQHSGKQQPLTLVARAPSRFFSTNSLREGYASNVRAAFRRDRGSGSYQCRFSVFSIASLKYARHQGVAPMWLIVVYVLNVLVGESIAIIAGLSLDRTYPSASLPISLSLFFIVFWLGWVLAVRWTKPKHGKDQEVSN